MIFVSEEWDKVLCKEIKFFNLVSVCDIDIKRVKETSDKYGVEFGYTDWKEMITTESIDLIIIATNGDTHHDITIFAPENGVPRVLCEKPMTTSLDKAKNMISVCEQNNTKLAIHHIRRWSESYRRLKEMDILIVRVSTVIMPLQMKGN